MFKVSLPVLILLLAVGTSGCRQSEIPTAMPAATHPASPLIASTPTLVIRPSEVPTSTPYSMANTPSATPSITTSVQMECPMISPEFVTPQPKMAARAGWCEIENANVRITYPSDWVVGAMGAAAQNRKFQRHIASGKTQAIGVIFSTTDLPIEQADRAMDGGYELSAPKLFVDPHETTMTKSLQTIADKKLLILTTEWETISIKRYFWLDQDALLIFEIRAPTPNFDSVEYKTLFSAVEEVISTVQVVRLPSKG